MDKLIHPETLKIIHEPFVELDNSIVVEFGLFLHFVKGLTQMLKKL